MTAKTTTATTTRRPSHRVLTTIAASAILGLTASACGAANETEPTGSAADGLSGTVDGAGSSAQQAAQDAWRAAYQTANPGVTVNYNPTGSGAGREQFLAGGVDFAGSDSALDPVDEVARARERCQSDPIEVPAYVSPISVVYHLPEVDDLRLDATTLARIFAGDITTWDDPAIAAQNPGPLPGTAITPVHRSDSSGTTENFTDYLHAAAPDAWPSEPDGNWPIRSGEAANQTSGMVAAVRAGAGTIAYVDHSQSGDLQVASVKVGGEYVAPSAEGAGKALGASPRESGRSETDLVVAVDRGTTAPGAYPLMLTSYLIACPAYPEDRVELVRGYLAHVVSAEGQEAAARAAGSAPLPDDLRAEAAALIDSITGR